MNDYQQEREPGLPHLDELSADVRTRLMYAAEAFVSGAEEPDLETIRWLEAKQGRQIDRSSSIYDFPSNLGTGEPNNVVAISIGGLLVAGLAPGLVEEFVKVVRVCVDIYLRDGPRARISGAALKEKTAVDSKIAARLGTLLQREHQLIGSGRPPPDNDWYFEISSNVVAYRDIRSVHDFFEVRSEQMTPRQVPSVVQPTMPLRVGMANVFAEPGLNYPLLDLDSLQSVVGGAVADAVSKGLIGAGVLQAALAFRDVLRERSGLYELDGIDLVNQAFASRLRPADDSRTAKTRFEGIRQIALGMMKAYRNLQAHVRDSLLAAEAAEAIATFSMLARCTESLPVRDEG